MSSHVATITEPSARGLCADGLAELKGAEHKLESFGTPVLAGDAVRTERETRRQHWMRCAGCADCWPESIERESDI